MDKQVPRNGRSLGNIFGMSSTCRKHCVNFVSFIASVCLGCTDTRSFHARNSI